DVYKRQDNKGAAVIVLNDDNDGDSDGDNKGAAVVVTVNRDNEGAAVIVSVNINDDTVAVSPDTRFA
ncbi:MAG: hypothetical protein MPK62_11180, partial [Alphaproteobacteria bacterium]|nr:hypothetical protein [Alphaproteobacteria bacterium]